MLTVTPGHAQDAEFAEPPPPEDMGLAPIEDLPPPEAAGTEAPADLPVDAVPPELSPTAESNSAPTPPESSIASPTTPALPRKRYIDRNKEPRQWPGPYLGVRLSLAGGTGLFPLADASTTGTNAGYMPILAPYLGLDFGYSWRMFGASLHIEGTGLTLPLSGQGEMPQHILMGIDLLFLPSLKWRFLAGLEFLDFVRMTAGTTGDAYWSKGFGLRAGGHYRLADWANGIAPSLFFHAAFHSYPMVEAVPSNGTAAYSDVSSRFVGGGLSSLSVLGFFGLQVDFQL